MSVEGHSRHFGHLLGASGSTSNSGIWLAARAPSHVPSTHFPRRSARSVPEPFRSFGARAVWRELTLTGHRARRRRIKRASSAISRTISLAGCNFDTRPTLCPAHSDRASMSPSAFGRTWGECRRGALDGSSQLARAAVPGRRQVGARREAGAAGLALACPAMILPIAHAWEW